MTSWYLYAFCTTCPLWGELIGHPWIPIIRAGNADVSYFLFVGSWDVCNLGLWRSCEIFIVINIKHPWRLRTVLAIILNSQNKSYIPSSRSQRATVCICGYLSEITVLNLYCQLICRNPSGWNVTSSNSSRWLTQISSCHITMIEMSSWYTLRCLMLW